MGLFLGERGRPIFPFDVVEILAPVQHVLGDTPLCDFKVLLTEQDL